MTKRVLFLISDTGGGHRAGAMAIGAALDEMDKETRFEWRIDDIAAHCTFPLSKLGPAYSAALRFAPPIYGALYHATNGRRRYRTIVRFCEPLYRERLKDVFTQYNPDVIVSVHPLLNHAALRARTDAHMDHIPIVTVITDLGRVHEGWLLPEADLTIVPAREVYNRALERGVPPSRLRLIGHPIHPKFEDVSATKAEIRAKLALPQDATIALLMAGGEGGGKLLPTTLALAKTHLPFHLVVVTGRKRRAEDEARRTRTVAAHADDDPRLPQRCARADARRGSARHQSRTRHARRSQCRRSAGGGVRLRAGPRARQSRLGSHQRDRRRCAHHGGNSSSRCAASSKTANASPRCARSSPASHRAARRAGSPN